MTIRSDRQGHTLVVTIDRPEAHNAISLEMGHQLIELWRAVAKDDDLRVAVLTGVGDRAFCAGADLKEVGAWYASMTPEERRHRAETEPGLGGITRNLDPGKPIIAAVNGACLAGGLELALACDIRIAAETATFGLPEVRWGLMPGAGGTQRLTRAMGKARAMDLCLTGDMFGADEALTSGLCARVYAADELMEKTMENAEKIAAFSSTAARMCKEAVNAVDEMSLEQGANYERRLFHSCFATKDQKEGMDAFVNKRTAEWTNQ